MRLQFGRETQVWEINETTVWQRDVGLGMKLQFGRETWFGRWSGNETSVWQRDVRLGMIETAVQQRDMDWE